ncbi:beta-galactosidase isoform X2 [Plodia interpunctella]|nr:beta-galactosidase isoform X2 [Plodia interpunctella]
MKLLLLIITVYSVSFIIAQVQQPSRAIRIVGDEFVLDDKPLQIVSGSLHYFRVPAEYWSDRLRKLRAAGLNAVSTYVEWSFHEPEERMYNFEGDRDLVRFIQLAAAEDLHVLLRPGPYICAERDLGGLPYWLLGKYHNISLRSTDKDFIEETKIWMNKLFTLLTPLLYSNGGPIILVQIENEYGSYSSDVKYKDQLFNIFKEHVAEAALLYTTDGGYAVRGGAIKNTLTTIDFGPVKDALDVRAAFAPLRQVMPTGPLMNSEFYSGWLTHWGESFQTGSTEDIISTLRSLLEKKVNINFYMFFGGSNFEFSAGANYFGVYKPDITSYDYDAPISEAGDLTQKYYAIRDLLYEFNILPPESLQVPDNWLKGAYGPWSVKKEYGLLTARGRSTLGKPYNNVSGGNLPTFESLRQRSGFVLYETTLNEDGQGLLKINYPRDRVYVFVNNDFVGIISRMHNILSLPIRSEANATLSLLVENQGRINYGKHKDIHDYKGILRPVLYNNITLDQEWKITGFPLEVLPTSVATESDQKEATWGPLLFEGTFTIPSGLNPLDTYLDTTGWGKGYIWVNGHNLGRYWPDVGPQITLYLPGVWLLPAPAINRIQILELESASPSREIISIGYPILNRPTRSHTASVRFYN